MTWASFLLGLMVGAMGMLALIMVIVALISLPQHPSRSYPPRDRGRWSDDPQK